MNLSKYINLQKMPGVAGLWSAIGSFGVIDGYIDYSTEENDGEKRYIYSNGKIELTSTFKEYEGGVVIRRDSFKNLTDEPVTVNRLVSRFRLKGNKYEVYTQLTAGSTKVRARGSLSSPR
jgi:hypothetical protein